MNKQGLGDDFNLYKLTTDIQILMSNLNRNYEDKPEMSNLDLERIVFYENYYYKMEE